VILPFIFHSSSLAASSVMREEKQYTHAESSKQATILLLYGTRQQ